MGDPDIPEGLRAGFWQIVVLLNVGPIALAAGVMAAVLGGHRRAGIASAAVGVAALVLAFYLYRRYSEEYVE